MIGWLAPIGYRAFMKGRGLRSLVEVTPRGQLPMEQHMEDIYDVYLLPPHLDAV